MCNKLFNGVVHMKTAKKAILILISLVMVIECGGCKEQQTEEVQSSAEASSIIVSDDRLEEIALQYLKEKYGEDLKISITDRPSSIYNSYYLTAYNEEFDSMNITISFTDENTYDISDDGLMLFIQDDLEKWFADFIDPCIDCEYKVFYRKNGFTLPDDYKECKTAEDFLELTPTSEYYGLLFTVLLPASEYEKSYTETASEIADRMAEAGIRGQVSILVYEEKSVYDDVNTRKKASWYWERPVSYERKYAWCGVQANFNVIDSKENY